MSVLAFLLQKAAKAHKPKVREFIFSPFRGKIKFINHLSRKKIRFPDFYFVGHEN